MALSAYLSLAKHYSIWVLYLLLSLTASLFRTIFWWLNGTRQKIQESKKPENYATSAHKMTIVFRHRLDEFFESALHDYIFMHHSFVSPEYVLRDDVHLMQITEKEAIFVQIAKGARGPEAYPFCILGYTLFAKHVITMPLASFNRLVDSMGKPEGKIIFLQNQARCGGTLFTEVFKATGRCITYCEPHALNGAVKLHYVQEKWDRKTMVEMFRRIIFMHCKPRKDYSEKILAYVIKPTALSMPCTDLIPEAIPEAIQFFIYRDPLKVSLSIRKIAEALPSLRLLYYLPNIPRMIAPLITLLGYCDVGYRGWTPKASLLVEWGYRLGVLTMSHHLKARAKGIEIHGIRYEHFRDNQEKMTSMIFDLCGLPSSLVSKATEAFSRDSQAESPIAQEIVNKLMPKLPVPSPAALKAIEEMSLEFGVPTVSDFDDDSFALEGSLQP